MISPASSQGAAPHMPTPPESSSPFNRTAQHDAKRLAILSQASRLFNSKGSRATTLQDVAQSLGLTKTSLYYYVKTKEDLIYRCYMAALAHHHQHLDEIEAKYDDPRDRCAALLYRHFDMWAAAKTGRGPYIAALLEIASLKGARREEVEARYVEMFKRIRRYLRDGVAQGVFRDCEPAATTRAILGSLEWTFSWLHDIPQEQVDETARAALDILTRGLYQGEGEHQPSPLHHEDESPALTPGFDRKQQKRLKQEAFYKTGTLCFNQQGFKGTSLDEIAERLNVSKGAFYYHIKNKEYLLFNCYNRSLDIVENIHQRAAALPGSGLQKLEYICRNIFQVQTSNEGPLIRYNTITALPAKRRRQVLDRTEATNRSFEAFIQDGIKDGSVREIDTIVARNLFAGATNAAMNIGRWIKASDTDQAATEYFDIFFNGLLPDSTVSQ